MFRQKQKKPQNHMENSKQVINMLRKLPILATNKMHLQRRITKTISINLLRRILVLNPRIILMFPRHLNTLQTTILISKTNNNLKKSPKPSNTPQIRQPLQIS